MHNLIKQEFAPFNVSIQRTNFRKERNTGISRGSLYLTPAAQFIIEKLSFVNI